jgi:hypothetical protein
MSETLPSDQANRLDAEAKAMGLPVPAYVEFLRNCQQRSHDPHFKDATRYVFKKYPETLKKLAQ